MNYTQLASRESVAKATQALTANNFATIVVQTKEEALAKVKEYIPQGVSVMNGSSTTLQEIGYINYLRAGKHGWHNLHDSILAEKDPVKQGMLRRLSVVSDYYVGSAHAVTEHGEIMVASNSGSQLPHLAYTSPNIILVVGTQKIVPDIQAAFKRLEKYVVPLEDARLQAAYDIHTLLAKTLILHQENPQSGRTIRLIFVNEKLGF